MLRAQDAPFLACALEPGSGQKAVLARQGNSLGVHDLGTGRRTLLVVRSNADPWNLARLGAWSGCHGSLAGSVE